MLAGYIVLAVYTQKLYKSISCFTAEKNLHGSTPLISKSIVHILRISTSPLFMFIAAQSKTTSFDRPKF